MENQLVKVDPAQYGLQAAEAAKVEAVFMPMIDKMKELEEEFNEIMALPIEPTTCKKAKALRLMFVKIRTGTAAIHKNAKEYYLKAGKFIDAWKNVQAFASTGKEEQLAKIENHYEILEAERKEKLKAERLEQLSECCDTPEMYPVADMSDTAFQQLLNGLKVAKQQREEAERKAEEERIENERLDKIENERYMTILPYRQFWSSDNYALREMSETNFQTIVSDLKKFKADHEAEQERIRIENERMRKEAEEAAKERARVEKEREEERKKAEQARIAAEKKAREEREAIEAKAKKEREEAEKKAAEQRRVAEEKAAKEREAARKEKERLEKLLADTIKCPHCHKEFFISDVKGEK